MTRGEGGMMKPGDFFLLSEPDWQSRLIQLGTHGPFNHAGLFADADGGTIEAFAAGVATGSLSRYAGKRCVAVDSGLTDAERAIAVAYARSCVGDSYDWWDILSFGVNLATNGKFIIGQVGKYICSALVFRSFQQANFARFPGDCHTESPNDLMRLYGVKA